MESPLLWQLALQVLLIALNAVFACAEIAIITLNDSRLERLTLQGDKRAIRLTRLTSQPARFLATIQVAITLSGFLGSAFAADNFSQILVDWLLALGVAIPAATLDAIAVVVITLILSYFTLVFGELVPKRLAMKKAEQLALGMATMIALISRLFAPIVWILTASTNCILRLCGIDPNAEEDEVSEEEIRMLVDKGKEKGVIDQTEKDFIQNLFAFDDLAVSEFSTHRTEVAVLWLEETPMQWEHTIQQSRHALYPICEETVDQVRGILNAKDYFRLSDRMDRKTVLAEAVKPPYFVPGSIRADVLFRQMKSSRNHFAVALDEYGGMMGIVTMNDLLEQLVGDLDDDESAPEEPPELEPLDSQTWRIRGSAALAEVSRALGVALPVADYDTFGGFVFGSHGFVPEDGADFTLDVGRLHIHVTKIRGHKLEQATVCLERE